MAIFVVLMAVSAFFLARQFRRDPSRFQRTWNEARRGARDSFPRHYALIGLAIVVGLMMLDLGRWPIVLMVLGGLAFLLFGMAWLREFHILIQLSDDIFPGRNDKLIWGLLLIVLPPVGVWLFRNYRMAHWPDVKPSRPSGWDDLA